MPALEDMKAARELLLEADEDITDALAKVNSAITEMEGETPPEPPPTPPPPPPTPPANTVQMQVKADPRCKTWCFQVWNETQGKLVEKRNKVEPIGYPIMQEYFSQEGKRITYSKGTVLTFFPDLVEADGSVDYMELALAKGDRGQRLFVARPDLMKLG
jgi:hypothetical protein